MSHHDDFNPYDWFWIIDGDETRVWSSADGAYLGIASPRYQTFISAGGVPSRANADDLTTWLGGYKLPGPLGNRWRVPTYRILRRLEDADPTGALVAAADTALASDQTLWRRFYTTPDIRADDPDALALLGVIGADPAVILAPDPGGSS
ncbi:hypothetical protein [Bauldia sp.]|uniref:hypothetical protein n=1 Tax=Bauldia sp. TaxID=2575872 RepID=UPI003BAD1AB5